MKYIPVNEYEWTNDFSYHRELRCKNHPNLKWLTKNPYQRSLHFVGELDDGNPIIGLKWAIECKCPFEDLEVLDNNPSTKESAGA